MRSVISPDRVHLFVGMILTALMSSCPSTTPTPAPCNPGQFPVPNPVSPADFAVVGSLTPTLTWDPGGTECVPTAYDIQLSTSPNFTNNINGKVSYPNTSFTPGASLNPGAEYWWKVAGTVQQGSQIHYGEYSAPRRFFTPGYCQAGDLVSPQLSSPGNGDTIASLQPLDWENGNDGCTPNNYLINLALDAQFEEIVFAKMGETPATETTPDIELQDCMRYFWRVTPLADLQRGPTSEIWWFKTDFQGACPAAWSASGTVWHDLCAVPWGPVDPSDLPPGCVEMPGGGLGANGIFESGEPGIPGVTLHIGRGTCPSTSPATALTDSNGEYTFSGLSAGTYCISVDALGDGNDLVLIPGGWTYPTPGDNPQMADVVVPGDVTGVDFGWDYQFLPAPEVDAQICLYKALRTINCRESDYQESSLIAIVEEGQSSKLIAISPDYSHGKFELQDLKTCWIWFDLLSGPESPQDCGVPIVDPPPAPEPVEPQECHSDLSEESCKARGGTWTGSDARPGECDCPD